MKIFISYRRESGEGAAKGLRKALEKTFGADAVFRDRDSLQPGDNWRTHISDSIAASDVVLVVISSNWVGESPDGSSRRIDKDDDPVHVEVKTALERLERDGITVVPILVDTEFPDRLPPDLAPIQNFEAIVPTLTGWADEVERLLTVLQEIDPDSPVNRSQLVPVAVGDQVRWLGSSISDPLVAGDDGGSFTRPSSLAISPDGVVVGQLVHGDLVLWALRDPNNAQYERWWQSRLAGLWEESRLIAIARRGSSSVSVALSYRYSSSQSKVGRFEATGGATSIERVHECNGAAASGAFVGSTLLYVDDDTKRVNAWPGHENQPAEWTVAKGRDAVWIDGAFVEGRMFLQLLTREVGALATSVSSFSARPERWLGDVPGPAGGRRIAVARVLRAGGPLHPRSFVDARGWQELETS